MLREVTDKRVDTNTVEVSENKVEDRAENIASLSANDDRWLLLKHKVLEKQLEKIFNFYHRKNLEPILIKGWAAGLYYPEPHRRVFSDFDLVFAPEDYVRAVELTKGNKLQIDLHCGLEKHDTVSWTQIFQNTQIKYINQTPIRILSPEDHLRVLCVHWLCDGGAFKSKLLDIYYLIENRLADFNWAKCLDVVSEKRRRQILLVIAVVKKYYLLETKNLPIDKELPRIPNWMIKTIEREWQAGVRLRPLQTCLHDLPELKRQILKRFPPNPIQSTIECGGEFNESPRIYYQIKNTSCRLIPALKRIYKTLRTGNFY